MTENAVERQLASDRNYLKESGMHATLEAFVSAGLKARPENVLEFMVAWAEWKLGRRDQLDGVTPPRPKETSNGAKPKEDPPGPSAEARNTAALRIQNAQRQRLALLEAEKRRQNRAA